MNKIFASLACCFLLLMGCASTEKMLVKSDPSGADIYINGEKVGKTPAELKVAFPENCQQVREKKLLSVRLRGYEEKKEVISPENTNNKTYQFILKPESSPKPDSPIASQPSVTAAR